MQGSGWWQIGAGRLEVGLLPDDACQNPERALRRVTEQLKGILCRSYTQAANVAGEDCAQYCA